MKKVIFLFVAFIIANTLNGQILYTDFVPDTALPFVPNDSTKHLRVDINHDGILDFGFSLKKWIAQVPSVSNNCSKREIYPLGNNKIGWEDTIHITGVPCYKIAQLSNTLIDDTSFYWRVIAYIQVFDWYLNSILLNCDASNGYFPVKLNLNGLNYFGWIRFMNDKIYDMAINLQPNDPISTAQITSIIEKLRPCSKSSNVVYRMSKRP